MFAELLQQFTGSTQHAQANTALAQQGFNPSQISDIFSHALPAATSALGAQTADQAQPPAGLLDIFGSHSGGSFLTGMLAGLVKGDGIGGSIKDGMAAMVTGRIAEALAPKLGIDAQTASRIAAAVTPFITQFVQEKLASNPTNTPAT